MDEGVVRVAEAPGREDLSPALLAHAATGQNFLGFLSYRRGDGLPLARWLRDRIIRFSPPQDLRGKIGQFDETVGGSQNRVFLDMSYQKPNVDFWDEHIAASLCRSKTLILLQTPSVFERLPDGSPNWCEREIETFLKYHGDPSRILVVMGPGAPIDRFPAPLERISARWDWIDLRFFSQSPITRWRSAAAYDLQVAKILAKVFDVADGDLPSLNREFAAARARVRRTMTVAAGTVFLGLSALTTWALVERGRATEAEHVALRERDEALRQRNAALISQSRFLATSADNLVTSGSSRGAIEILKNALPSPAGSNNRPLVFEAIASAYGALYENRETGRIELPFGTLAVATDGEAGHLVAATSTELNVRETLATVDWRVVKHDFGTVSRLTLAPNNRDLALIGPGGAVEIVDLDTGAAVLRHPGVGKATNVFFLNADRLLIADTDSRQLRLLDRRSGQTVAERQLPDAPAAPVVLGVDRDTGLIVAAAGGQVRRLSIEDLSDQATYAAEAAKQFAMRLSPDGSALYLAATTGAGDPNGEVVALDPSTLAVKQAIGKVIWGVQGMELSKRWGTLAVRGTNGIDFFDTKKNERIYHVSSNFSPIGGRFMGASYDTDYFAYGLDGSIQRWTVDLGSVTGSYYGIDGGAVLHLDRRPDGKGFLAITDRPAITNWSFDKQSAATKLATPMVVNGVDFHMDWISDAIAFIEPLGVATVGYIDRSILRWNLETGTSTPIRAADFTKDVVERLVGLVGGDTVAVRKSGAVEIYRAGADPHAAPETIASEPIKALGPLGPRRAFLLTASGKGERLDVDASGQSKIEPIAALGSCMAADAVMRLAYCLGTDGAFRVWNDVTGSLIVDLPYPPGSVTYAATDMRPSVSMVVDRTGTLTVRRISDGATILTTLLKATYAGEEIKIAAIVYPKEEGLKTALRTGADRVEVPVQPITAQFDPDGTHLAMVFGAGLIQVYDLRDGSKQEFRPMGKELSVITRLAYSAHGTQLATVAVSFHKHFRVMTVMDAASGRHLARISLDDQIDPNLYPIPSGKGFATTDPGTGKVQIYPVFEDANDLIDFLSKTYPEQLTPAQKRAFFIE
jgi:WD40 repeat protein